MPRENYFVVLGIDPTDDWSLIEAALKAKRQEWTMGLNHPTRKHEFKKLLGQYPQMERLLKDATSRCQEADDARQQRRKENAQKLARLDESIQVTAAKGYLTEEDVKELVRGSGLPEKDVRHRVQTLGIAVRAGASKPRIITPDQRLDDVLNKKILSHLEALGKEDLYAFLGAPRSSSTKELKARAVQEYTVVRTQAVKTPEVTMRQELLGHCQHTFKSDTLRQKYDNTLQWNKLEEIRRLAEQAGAGEGEIHAASVEELIKRGLKQRLAAEEVTAAIQEVCMRHQPQWKLRVPVASTASLWQRCGACGELAPGGAAACTSCGRSFQVSCPKCGITSDSSAQFCGNPRCSFSIGDMPYATRALRSARAELTSNPAEAERLIEEALRYWPDHPKAMQLQGQLRQQQEQLRKMIASLEAALVNNRFEEAERALPDLERLAPDQPQLPTWRRLIQNKLCEAKGKVAEGQGHEGQGRRDEAVACYQEALGICADCTAALDRLRNCPPEPPAHLHAALEAGPVRLRWPASPSRGQLRYRVVRKEHAPPHGATDGQVIATVAETTLLDPEAPTGVPLYYTVYTDRSGVCSLAGAGADPLLRLAEVQNLRVLGRDGSVELSWQLPTGAVDVEVWRAPDQPPTRRGQGQRLAVVGNTGAVDSGLSNDRTQGYLIVALFRGLNGQLVASAGVSRTAVPVPLPEPVTDLRLARVGNDVEATWQPPARGEVIIFLHDDPSKLPRDTPLDATELAQFGRRLEPLGRGRALDRAAPKQPRSCYTVAGGEPVGGKNRWRRRLRVPFRQCRHRASPRQGVFSGVLA